MVDTLEQKTMRHWKTEEHPLVSICCVTYNHESYISETIEGFLLQETDFPFEILIYDDCSTDNTAGIIKQYEKKYPNLIKPIYQKENQFSKGIKPNLVFNFPRAEGKYIALCEGDDYWVDPGKLQKQVDFLEKNRDYVVSGHDAFIVDGNGNRLRDSKLPHRYQRDFSGEELILGKAWILTMSMVFRNVLPEPMPYEITRVLNVDTFLTSLLGHYGKSKYHPDIRAAGYRAHPNGIWSMRSKQEKRHGTLNTYFWLYSYYHRTSEEEYSKHFLSEYDTLLLASIRTRVMFRELWNRIYTFFRSRLTG